MFGLEWSEENCILVSLTFYIDFFAIISVIIVNAAVAVLFRFLCLSVVLWQVQSSIHRSLSWLASFSMPVIFVFRFWKISSFSLSLSVSSLGFFLCVYATIIITNVFLINTEWKRERERAEEDLGPVIAADLIHCIVIFSSSSSSLSTTNRFIHMPSHRTDVRVCVRTHALISKLIIQCIQFDYSE